MTDPSTADHEQPDLFASDSDNQPVETRDLSRQQHAGLDVADCSTDDKRAARTRNSMLWAAYGDALGFISELVDCKRLEQRTHGAPLDHLMDWQRRVGGKSGVNVTLPAGCWSDDTQLRMAVSRSIGNHGFDIDTFSQIELPVWLSYALGGGRASKAAAMNLGKPRTLWYANTFRGWTSAGGNGAAMRIQPHVWASPDLEGGYLNDVIANSVCTHGHPRAIVGACFHAETLAHCLRYGTVPDPETCVNIAGRIGVKALRLIEEHAILGSIWIDLWDQAIGERFGDTWRKTVDELIGAIGAVAEITATLETSYPEIVARLGLKSPKQQGSGILTTVAAVAAAATASKAHEGVVVAANAIGTDTDTIATMVGALVGACDAAADPPEKPLDSEYLLQEAERLTAISLGHRVESHRYPDILTWTAPRTQADALVNDNGALAVEGLGPATQLAESAIYTPRKDFAWEWVKAHFGQTLLIKRRPQIIFLEAGNKFTPPQPPRKRDTNRLAKPDSRDERKLKPIPLDRGIKVDDAIEYAKEQIFDDAALGYTVRRVARDGTIADLAALVTDLRDDLRQT
ncbi:MAG: ADP-ribosylglycohydrolase family protein [Acidimicrobiaceae bacterium]|nr:ADP-ribosylglycohydrolase family protein [Acidimicrobiaceae bacterium]